MTVRSYQKLLQQYKKELMVFKQMAGKSNQLLTANTILTMTYEFDALSERKPHLVEVSPSSAFKDVRELLTKLYGHQGKGNSKLWHVRANSSGDYVFAFKNLNEATALILTCNNIKYSEFLELI